MAEIMSFLFIFMSNFFLASFIIAFHLIFLNVFSWFLFVFFFEREDYYLFPVGSFFSVMPLIILICVYAVILSFFN
jgi:hypothetical protein